MRFPIPYATPVSNLVLMRNDAMPLRLGVVGTSLEAGSSNNRWTSYLYKQLMETGFQLNELNNEAAGGANLSTISTTQLDAVLNAGCNVVLIGGPVNDYAVAAANTGTAKATAITIVTTLVGMWRKCLSRGVIPIQLAGGATNAGHKKGVLHLNRLLRRAADRLGVPFIDGTYTASVNPADGGAFTSFTTDGTHIDRDSAPVFATIVGNFFKGVNLYDIYLNHGVHDYDNTYSGLSIVDSHAFIDSGGSASTTNLNTSGSGSTYSQSACDGIVAKGFWQVMTRNATGTNDCYFASPGNLVQLSDEIIACCRVKMASMSGGRSMFCLRTQGSAFSASKDEPNFLCEVDFADPGFIAVNTRPIQTANGAVWINAKNVDYGSGTNTGVISVAMMSVINLSAIDRDLDAAGLSLPRIA